MKTLAITPQTPCLVTTATQRVVQGQQTSATIPPAPTHLSTAEVRWCSNTLTLSISLTFNWYQTINSFCPCTAAPTQIFLSDLDASDRQGRSASLSSDDVLGLSQSQQTLSRSSTLPYDHIPQRAQPQRGLRTKNCPSSPGSEMVTLEEFLKESNLHSPPMVFLLLLHFFYWAISIGCCGSNPKGTGVF